MEPRLNHITNSLTDLDIKQSIVVNNLNHTKENIVTSISKIKSIYDVINSFYHPKNMKKQIKVLNKKLDKLNKKIDDLQTKK